MERREELPRITLNDSSDLKSINLDYPTPLQPARQPEAIAAGFESNRNPRDSAASPD